MVINRFVIALGAVVDDVNDVVENIARRLPRRLPTRLVQGRTEVVRCRGTTQSGAQCRRRPVPDSTYCYQHRSQAKSEGRLFVVIGARNKAAKMTSELSQITSTATFNATSRLATLSPKLRTQVLSGAWILRVRQTAGRIVESIQAQKRWVTSAMVLLLIAAVPIAFLTVADGDLGVLASFVEEIIPRNPPAIERNSNAVGGPGTPNDDPNASGLFTPDGTRTPGTDFAGAYISGVEHLSLNSSMLQIFVPAGAQGTYLAVVTASEGVDYRCVILYHYTDRIHCIGPSLPEGSQINVQLFKLDEVEGSQILVFETNYATGDFGPVATPSPAFPVYGGAFIWPDRFDGVEIRKEQQSSAMLAPLSALLGVLLIVIYRVQAHREHPLNHRLVDSHELEPAH